MTRLLKIAVSVSECSNDHQARTIVDNEGWLGAGALGLDPPDLMAELHREASGETIVGRCDCGTVGCSDVTVRVTRTDRTVEWSGCSSSIAFDAGQYDAEVARFSNDHSWETVGRRVEREVNDLFAGSSLMEGHRFDWASTRIQLCRVHLSYSSKGDQRMLEFAWDGVSSEDALTQARVFHAHMFAGD